MIFSSELVVKPTKSSVNESTVWLASTKSRETPVNRSTAGSPSSKASAVEVALTSGSSLTRSMLTPMTVLTLSASVSLNAKLKLGLVTGSSLESWKVMLRTSVSASALVKDSWLKDTETTLLVTVAVATAALSDVRRIMSSLPNSNPEPSKSKPKLCVAVSD